jgi:predicted Zn-dependent peptidase
MMIRRIAITAMLALGLAAPVMAQKEVPPEGDEPKDFTLPEARTFTLDNGMDVTFAPYGELPKVVVRLAIRAGNVNEEADEIWLADLTGDYLMEGTTSRDAEAIARAAAEMGGSVDVGVSPDETTVGGDALSEFAPDLVRLVADIALNPAFPPDEIDRLEADLVRQVTIARSEPQQIALEKFRQVMYPNHSYGRIFPTTEMLEGYTREEVQAFYAANYGAARSHLYVSGRFDADDVEAAIREAFSGWARGSAPSANPPSPVSERKVWLIDRPGAVQSTLYIGLPVPDPSHEEYVDLLVTNTLIGGSFNSRITQNIRETKGYTYSPFSVISSRMRDAYWVQVADVTTAVTGPSLHEIFHEIDRLQEAPPSPEELEGIQNYLAGVFVLQNGNPAAIIGQLRFLDLHGLDRSYLEEYVSNVYAVTPEDVSRLAREYLDDSKMIIVVAGDRSVIEEQVAPYGEIVVDTPVAAERPVSPPLRRE